jgi:hypothetical protein
MAKFVFLAVGHNKYTSIEDNKQASIEVAVRKDMTCQKARVITQKVKMKSSEKYHGSTR